MNENRAAAHGPWIAPLSNKWVLIAVVVVVVGGASWAVDIAADHGVAWSHPEWLRYLAQFGILSGGYLLLFGIGLLRGAHQTKADIAAGILGERFEARATEAEHRGRRIIGYAIVGIVVLVVGAPLIAWAGTTAMGIGS